MHIVYRFKISCFVAINVFGGRMKEKLSYLSLISIGVLSAAVILYLGMNYILPLLLPFIISWLIATAVYSPSERISRISGISERILRLILSLLTVIIMFLAVFLFIRGLTLIISDLIGNMKGGEGIYKLMDSVLSANASLVADILPEGLASKVTDAIGAMLSAVLSAVAEVLTAFVGALPKVFLFLLATIISLVYFSLDYDRISVFLDNILPNGAFAAIRSYFSAAVGVIGKYVRSYSIILAITYLTVFFGFLILSVENPASLALLVALLDLLPIIGVGTVLIPWSIMALAAGNRFMGIGLIILFVVNSVIRQLAEPKIVGKSLDLHPIITLILIYVGYSLFGATGLLLLPLVAVIVSVSLNKNKTSEVG